MTTIRKPNPQGKGLTPVLDDWSQFRPSVSPQRSPEKLLAAYFTSMLVLSAEFNFKPVIGNTYYLYHRANRWQLSLIEPERWYAEAAADCLGRCELKPDMTWSIQPMASDETSSKLSTALHRFAAELQHLVMAGEHRDQLPFYVDSLPYYRRLAASGLAGSLHSAAPDFIKAIKPLVLESETAALAGWLPQ